MKHIRIYKTPDGKEPFNTWLENIKDKTTKARICRRIDRLYLGNEGDHKYLSRNSKGNPRFITLGNILKALGFKLSVNAL